MLTYAKIKSNRRKFLALTGLTPKEFDLLWPAFERAYGRRDPPSKTRAGANRQRQAGGGRKSVLYAPEQKLLFALVYLKAHPLQVLVGEVFERSQPRANSWIHHLWPVLQQARQDLGVSPERNPHRFARRERKRGEPLDFIIDGPERRRQRPKNKAKRDEPDSGHKQMHSDKNLVIAHRKTKRIGFLSQTYAGKVQDQKIADDEHSAYPCGARLHKDTGFQAYALRGVETFQPKKSRAKASQSPARNDTIAIGHACGCGWNTVLAEPNEHACSKKPCATVSTTFRISRWNSAAACIIGACVSARADFERCDIKSYFG